MEFNLFNFKDGLANKLKMILKKIFIQLFFLRISSLNYD